MVNPCNLNVPEERLPSLPIDLNQVEGGSSLWADAWYRLRKNRFAVISLVVFLGITLFSYVGPFFCPYGFEEMDLATRAQGLSLAHWFGTDGLGRDLLARVMYGGRISIGVGFIATAISLSIGVVYGAISGYAGGKIDSVMMRLVDILYAMPYAIFIILLMVIFGRNIVLLFVALGAVQWLTIARIVRGQVLSLKKQEFVEAAVSLGLSDSRIILRHVIPNVLGVVIVYATLTVPSIMLLEAFLSFLGLGVQPPMASWGVLIKDGAENMTVYPWTLLIPSFFFSLTLFCLNFLGDGLRDALDPRSSKD
ncbi:MAG: ABC transporter permease subunit [Opitutales bacterium]|nr:ABC transporter permease subunit [Opitutales bacterium]